MGELGGDAQGIAAMLWLASYVKNKALQLPRTTLVAWRKPVAY
jgi:hypothetical protein